MTLIKIVDHVFAPSKYSTNFQTSKYIEWDRTPVSLSDRIVFYTDNSLEQLTPSPITIAWLLESPDITPKSHKWVRKNNKKFTYVLTHSKKLLKKGGNYIFAPTAGCWIKPEDQKIYQKTRTLSTIASAKKITKGHRLRHQAIEFLGKNIDVYGRGYQPVDYKLEALQEYRFSLTIENANEDYYFTEKLIDCFMTGTVPLYWGCPSIGKFFDLRGMILFNKVSDLKKISLSKEKYDEMLPYIQANFEKAKEYLIAEDYIFLNLLKKII